MGTEIPNDSSLSSPDKDKHAAVRWLGILTVCFILLYGITWRVQFNGDSQAHLYSAASLAWSSDFELSEYDSMLRDRNGGALPYFVFESGDHLFSIFNFTPGLLLAPFFKLAGLFGETVHNDIVIWGHIGRFVGMLFLYFAGVCVWLLLWRRIGPLPASLALVALWFGSSFWPLCVDYLQHQPAAFFRAAALLTIFGMTSESKAGIWRSLAAGLLFAVAVLCRYQTAPAVAFVAIACGWWGLGTARERIAFAAGLLVLVPLTMLYHALVFGSALRIGPTLWLQFSSPFFYTLSALLVNPSKGILPHSPWVVLLLFAFIRPKGALPLNRRDNALRLICLLSILPTLFLYSKLNGWFAGWSWGWRYLLDAGPEIAILFGIGVARWWGNRILRASALALLTIGIGIQGLGAFTYDGDWHAKHDLGIGPSQAWLWQVRDSQILYQLRRGKVYITTRPIQWRDNPYDSQGLYGREQWGETSVSWTAPQAHFMFLATENPARLHVFSPSLPDGVNQSMTISVNGKQCGVYMLQPGNWNDIELPQVPFQHSALLDIDVQPIFHEDGPSGRALGVALRLEQIR
ncbi:hypothetical protein KQI84_01680 [bacterium]|nr:hypothetical protein [bacterium]